jgi:hypothetical protein
MMLFGKKTISATVRTREELASALTTADEIAVEGDERLQEYATQVVEQLDRDREERQRILRPAEQPRWSAEEKRRADHFQQQVREQMRRDEQYRQQTYQQQSAVERKWPGSAAHTASRSQSSRSAKWSVVFNILIASLIFALFKIYYTPPPLPPAIPDRPPPPVSPLPPIRPIPPENPISTPTEHHIDVVSLAWVGVAALSVILIYFAVSRAIAGDRNVELTWKVTSHVSGRLLIKKVPVSTTRRQTLG